MDRRTQMYAPVYSYDSRPVTHLDELWFTLEAARTSVWGKQYRHAWFLGVTPVLCCYDPEESR